MATNSNEEPENAIFPPPLLTTEPNQAGSLPVAIIEAVAAVSDVPPTELPPIDEAVDPDALDALFSRRPNNVRVCFEYAGYTVVLQDEIRIYETDPDRLNGT